MAEEEAAEEKAGPSAPLPAEQPFFPCGTSFALVLVADEDSELDHMSSNPPMVLEATATVANTPDCLVASEAIEHVLTGLAVQSPGSHRSTRLCSPHSARHSSCFCAHTGRTMEQLSWRC